MLEYSDISISMKTKIDKFIGILLMIVIFAGNAAFSYAEDDFEDVANLDESIVTSGDQEVEAVEVVEADDEMALKQEEFLQRLHDEINFGKLDYKQLLNNITDTKQRIEHVQDEQISLKRQLRTLDSMIEQSTTKLVGVIRNVVGMENEIRVLLEEIELREIALAYQKNLLQDYLRILYKEQSNYFIIDDQGQIDAFKMLLADGSVGENLRELQYIDMLNEAGIQIVERLTDLNENLKSEGLELERKRNHLAGLQELLQKEKDQLELQKESKGNLLRLTQGQEEIFSKLLDKSYEEQEDMVAEIHSLQNALTFMEDKIAEEGADFDPDDYASMLDDRTKVLYNFHVNYPGGARTDFIWPVEPDLGISAYFRDPGYVSVFGVRHNATDIPEYQGSPVRAALDGVVYTARDNGYGYSYIILAHANGFMTVYGHMSSILVEEGTTLRKGDIIGLSGGMPGTVGAGYMTTGPHLHFEVLLNGMYVDALDYLPLEHLQEEDIENLPEKYRDDWELAVLGDRFDGLEELDGLDRRAGLGDRDGLDDRGALTRDRLAR